MITLLGALPYWQFGPWPKEPFMVGPLPLQIHSFGLLVALGLLIGISWLSWRAERKEGIHGEQVQNFSLFLVAIGWPLAHVFNVIFYEPQLLRDDPMELFRVWGSVSSYGGLFGGMIAFAIWVRRFPKSQRLQWGEIGVMGLVIPWFFGRLGCATVHDHPGALAANWFLAIDFPTTSKLPGGPRHDLGLYEAMWWGVILAIMFWLDRKPRRRGFYVGLIPVLYAPARFAFDFLRVPHDLGGDARYFGLTPAQYFSIAIFGVGVYFLWRSRENQVVTWRAYKPGVKGDATPPDAASKDDASDTAASPSQDATTTASEEGAAPAADEKQKKS